MSDRVPARDTIRECGPEEGVLVAVEDGQAGEGCAPPHPPEMYLCHRDLPLPPNGSLLPDTSKLPRRASSLASCLLFQFQRAQMQSWNRPGQVE